MSDPRNPSSPQPSYGEPVGQNREPESLQQSSNDYRSEEPIPDSMEEEE